MTDPRPFAPEPPRRRFGVIPFPIILPGCCGCGFVAAALVAVSSLGTGWLIHEGQDAPPAPAVIQEQPGR